VNTIGAADKKSKKALAKAKKGDKKGKKSAPASPSSPMDSKQKQKLGLGKSLVKKLPNNNPRKAMEEENAQTQPSLFRLVVKKVGGEDSGECIYKLSSCERKGNQATKSTSTGRIAREKSNNQLNSSINNNGNNSSTNGPSKGGGEPLFFGKDDHDGKLKSQEKQKGSGKANYTLKLLEKKPVGEAKVAPIVTLSNITIA